MKNLIKSFLVVVAFLIMIPTTSSFADVPVDAKCPCVTSTDPDHPAGTKVCSGAPDTENGCTCNAFCND